MMPFLMMPLQTSTKTSTRNTKLQFLSENSIIWTRSLPPGPKRSLSQRLVNYIQCFDKAYLKVQPDFHTSTLVIYLLLNRFFSERNTSCWLHVTYLIAEALGSLHESINLNQLFALLHQLVISCTRVCCNNSCSPKHGFVIWV